MKLPKYQIEIIAVKISKTLEEQRIKHNAKLLLEVENKHKKDPDLLKIKEVLNLKAKIKELESSMTDYYRNEEDYYKNTEIYKNSVKSSVAKSKIIEEIVLHNATDINNLINNIINIFKFK